MDEKDADRLHEQVKGMTDSQLWKLIRWLVLEWANRWHARTQGGIR